MKYEWKKSEKDVYLPKSEPEVLTVGMQRFFMIDGQGDPNGEDFADRIGVLYALAYGVKMFPKKGTPPDGWYDFSIYPLEGVWSLSERGRQQASLAKDELVYTIMIRQPDFVTADFAQEILESVGKKKGGPLYAQARFADMTDGLCVQSLHVGSYDDEPATFANMNAWAENNGYERMSPVHREIYITDARKTVPEKRKTVLRFRVRRK